MNFQLNIFEKIAWNRYVQHISFWVVSFYILFRLFAYSEEVETVDLIYTFLFHIALVFVTYLNIWFLIPKFLQKRKYLIYFSGLVILILIGIGINNFTFNYLADLLFPNYFFIDYYNFFDILEFIFAYILITSLFMFSKSWFRQFETRERINLLEKEKLDAEIMALKGQINPHFLFNSLNNLYALSLDEDERVPDIILRLSGMMRYLLYETNVELVPLEKEVEHLKNFIEMHQLRLGEDSSIHWHLEGEIKNKKITPLLFLPLVENAFKHGVKGNNKNSFAHFNLKITDEKIIFISKNTIAEVDEFLKEKSGGVGLENLKKRLHLAYPEKHNLEIKNDGEIYEVLLSINLNT